MRCKTCELTFPEGSEFCGSCGNRLVEVPVGTSPPAPMAPTARRTGRPWLVGIVMIVVAAAAVGTTWFLMRNGDSTPAAADPTVAPSTAPPAESTTVPPSTEPPTTLPATTSPPTTAFATTSTLSESDLALGVAEQYFALLAADRAEDGGRAAAASTGLASKYAAYISSAPYTGTSEPLIWWVGEVVDGAIRLCNSDQVCSHYYSEFVVIDGMLDSFSLDGTRLAGLMWDRDDLWPLGWCRVREGSECNWDDPEAGDNLYIGPEYAYVSRPESGPEVLVIVWDVWAGDQVFSLAWEGDGEHGSFLTDANGLEHTALTCWGNPIDLDLGTDGLELPAGARTYLWCIFEGVGTGARSDVTVTLIFTWDGDEVLFDFDLPALP